MAGAVLACVIVSSRWTGIVDRDCYPCLPSTIAHLSVPNDRRKKTPVKGFVFNVWPSVVTIAFHDAIHALNVHAQK